MPQLVEAVTCHRCNAPGQIELFCQNCGLFLPDATGTVERVTFTRRFFGTSLLEGILLIVTLVIGWLIWFAFMASTAQSPAKRMLNVYVIDANTGRAVSPGRMWVRDPLVKILLVGYIVPFGGLITGLFVLFDKNRQSLTDKIVSTIVVYAPQGLPEAMRAQVETYAAPAMPAAPAAPVTPAPPATPAAPGATIAGSTPGAPIGETEERLRELTRLRDEGIITQQEYEQKRAELARHL